MQARRNTPLAASDAIEWGSRRLDMAILGLFVSPAVVGIYYVAQQVASLPQKLKTSFDPILGRSEEHTSELQSLMRIAYAVFCFKKKSTTETPYLNDYWHQGS